VHDSFFNEKYIRLKVITMTALYGVNISQKFLPDGVDMCSQKAKIAISDFIATLDFLTL